MRELKQFKIFLPVIPVLFILLFFIMLLGASSSDHTTIINSFFTVPFLNDVDYTITSSYGIRKDPLNKDEYNFHRGIDISASKGTNIVAAADGIVDSVIITESGGETVVIEHNFNGVKYKTRYLHMLENSIIVIEGQQVLAKEKIGIIGMSGTRVTGVHLHFELHSWDEQKKEFIAIDPANIFKKIIKEEF